MGHKRDGQTHVHGQDISLRRVSARSRMKLLERRKGKGKRFWFYEDSLKVMKEIIEEWT